jgi:deoxyribodipyrimidine photolyase
LPNADLTPVILWFRRDLRLADNPALNAAAATGRPVIPVYILDEAGDGPSTRRRLPVVAGRIVAGAG